MCPKEALAFIGNVFFPTAVWWVVSRFPFVESLRPGPLPETEQEAASPEPGVSSAPSPGLRA